MCQIRIGIAYIRGSEWVSNSRKEEKGRAYLVGASPRRERAEIQRRRGANHRRRDRRRTGRATALVRPGVAAREGRLRASEREREVNRTGYEGQGKMNGTGGKILAKVGKNGLATCMFRFYLSTLIIILIHVY